MKNVIISNKDKFETIKKNLLNGSFKNLHFLSDFDRTLTKIFTNNGKLVPSLISILRDEDILTKEYSEKAKALFEKYHPIEIDNSLSIEEKTRYMQEWWEKHFKLLIETGLNKKDIEKVIRSDRIVIREYLDLVLKKLFEKQVPFVILSANALGISSTIEVLKLKKIYFENIFVISNDYIWDKDGYAIDFKGPIIHTFNKDETILLNFPEIFKKVKSRKNVILLGDSLGDVKMVEGFDYENLLKIGFLNNDVEKNLEEYKKVYDVVIVGDGDFKFIYNLLNEFEN